MPASPAVTAVLSLGGQTLNLPLTGPATLPASIPDGLGVVQHSLSDTFTATIPASWVKTGLQVTVNAGAASVNFTNLKVGAPTKVIMTMFDVHYFADTTGDYPAGWQEELEAKWPVADLEIRRVPNVIFHELVIPPRPDVSAQAARVKSQADYTLQTGLGFDGEQAAALAWNGALKRAAGRSGRISLYYINIYGANAGGQAGGFAGVGNGTSVGILHHELGHALSLPALGRQRELSLQGRHVRHPRAGQLQRNPRRSRLGLRPAANAFIPPTVQPGNVGNNPAGTYKVDPMQGGGTGYQEPGFLMNHFSDYSVFKMRDYLDGHVLVWNESLNSYASWNQAAGAYTSTVSNNGVQYPLERDVQVISVMASISGAKPDVNMVYPPIGPYTAGLIRLFDPRVPADRSAGVIHRLRARRRLRRQPACHPGRRGEDLHARRFLGADCRSALRRQFENRSHQPARGRRGGDPGGVALHPGCPDQRPARQPAGACHMGSGHARSRRFRRCLRSPATPASSA